MYKVSAEAVRRASKISSDRFSKKDEEGVESGKLTLRSNRVPPRFKTQSGMSWAECIFQIFFTNQGPPFFLLPGSVKGVGYLPAIVGSVFISIFFGYMVHTYLWCEKEIRKRKNMSEEKHLSIYSLVEHTLEETAVRRRIATYLNFYLKYEIILSWGLSLSFANVFVCQNINVVLQYIHRPVSNTTLLLLMFPVTSLVSMVPNMRAMAKFSYFTICSIMAIIVEILYFAIVDRSPLPEIEMVQADLLTSCSFVATLFFNVVFTPLLFSFKNDMKNPQQFGSVFGSFNTSEFILLFLNLSFALIGYIRYGQATSANILENLPQNNVTVVSNVIFVMAMIQSGAVSFFIIFEALWDDRLKAVFAESKHLKLYEYLIRTLINFVITIIALAIPSLDLLTNLIACFSYPYDSVCLPLLMRTLLMWKHKHNLKFFCFLGLNSILLAASVFFAIYLSYATIIQIVATFW